MKLSIDVLQSLLVFILWTYNRPIQGHLLDYPLKASKGSLSIFTTLTDVSTQVTWTVKETLIDGPKVHGKIETTKGNDRMEVFYHENENMTRLLFYENECHEMKHTENGWSSMIPTINKPLLNMAFLVGPSFYYRLVAKIDSFFIQDNVKLRGEPMKSLVARVDNSLSVSFIFPVALSSYIGIRQPKRLILTDKSGGQPISVIYDIHHEIKLPSTFAATQGTPTLGVGCPRYFELNRPSPSIGAKRYHLNVIETIKTTKETKSVSSELSIDSRNKITRVTSVDRFGSKQSERSIYVYNLGIKYFFSNSNGKCLIVPLSLDDGSSIDDNLIKINPITLDIRDFKYVGQVSYEHRSGSVDVWESTEYNVTIGPYVYDKIVTTQFMAQQFDDLGRLASDYLPIAAERKFYKLNLDKYILSESRKRDFYDFDTINYDETDYRHSFQITDCYNSPDDKIYLTLQITSSELNYQQAADYAAQNIYLFRETIKQIIAANLKLSYLRITEVDIEFEGTQIVTRVEIIKGPDILDSLEMVEYKIDSKSLDDYHRVSISDTIDCLKALAAIKDTRYVISCLGTDICVGVRKGQPLPLSSSTGSYCNIYDNRNDKLRRLTREITLEQIVQRFSDLIGLKFNLVCADCLTKFEFSIVDVAQDSSLDTAEPRMLFMDIESGEKIDSFHGESIVGVRNFGDCYRACSSSKGSTCETFSFCTYSDPNKPTECLISSSTYEPLSINGTISDSSCSIYGKNNLLDYHKVSRLKFTEIQRSQGALTVRTVDECARVCASSKETCYSFQICDSHYCAFAGHFAPSNTVSDTFCDIYIPKTIENFVKQNHKLIEPILQTELDMTLDQCASMCSALKGSEDQSSKCKSFNYCPRGVGASICQLTSETISSSTPSQVKSSDNCANYEYVKAIAEMASSTEQYQTSNSNSAISVVIFFVAFGLAMGWATPWAHKHLKERARRYINDDSTSTSTQFENLTVSTAI